LPRQPAETLNLNAAMLQAEVVLLRLRRVPHVVRSEENDKENNANPAVIVNGPNSQKNASEVMRKKCVAYDSDGGAE
jgi:hypothetical protein